MKHSGIDKNRWYIPHGWTNGEHQSCEWRESALSARDGKLLFTLSSKGGKLRPIGCPAIQYKERTGYGRYEARMRTAAGSGLNTAFFTYIGPPLGVAAHDEIDFEFLGKEPEVVEITHWANGQKNPGIKIPLGYDASKEFHNYTFDWRPDSISWYVDDKLVYKTPKGSKIPNNPGYIYFSLWSGSKIEDAWMGPFVYQKPVTAEVMWVKFTPAQ